MSRARATSSLVHLSKRTAWRTLPLPRELAFVGSEEPGLPEESVFPQPGTERRYGAGDEDVALRRCI